MEASDRESARDLCNLFSRTSDATVVHGDQRGCYYVSVTFGGLNDEELQAVAAILFRSHGFRSVTADDVRTLAAITRLEEFRREDRFL
jgi:hypothetical protein